MVTANNNTSVDDAVDADLPDEDAEALRGLLSYEGTPRANRVASRTARRTPQGGRSAMGSHSRDEDVEELRAQVATLQKTLASLSNTHSPPAPLLAASTGQQADALPAPHAPPSTSAVNNSTALEIARLRAEMREAFGQTAPAEPATQPTLPTPSAGLDVEVRQLRAELASATREHDAKFAHELRELRSELRAELRDAVQQSASNARGAGPWTSTTYDHNPMSAVAGSVVQTPPKTAPVVFRGFGGSAPSSPRADAAQVPDDGTAARTLSELNAVRGEVNRMRAELARLHAVDAAPPTAPPPIPVVPPRQGRMQQPAFPSAEGAALRSRLARQREALEGLLEEHEDLVQIGLGDPEGRSALTPTRAARVSAERAMREASVLRESARNAHAMAAEEAASMEREATEDIAQHAREAGRPPRPPRGAAPPPSPPGWRGALANWGIEE